MAVVTSIKVMMLLALLLPALASAATNALQTAIDAISAGNASQGYEQLMPLAREGNLDAQVMAGILYSEGQGTDRDINKARFWFKRAAYKGRLDAAYLLGLSYLHDDSTDKEFEQAVYWIKYAARRDIHAAQRFMALAYEYGWMNIEISQSKSQYWWKRYHALSLAQNSRQ